VLLASIMATRAATRVGLPSLLLFLGVGVIVGEDVIGLQFDNYLLADHLGTVALAIILIEGGLTTKFGDVRKVLAPAAVLATVGVAVSMVVTAAGAHLLLGIDWQLALLIGAVVSSTDAEEQQQAWQPHSRGRAGGHDAGQQHERTNQQRQIQLLQGHFIAVRELCGWFDVQ